MTELQLMKMTSLSLWIAAECEKPPKSDTEWWLPISRKTWATSLYFAIAQHETSFITAVFWNHVKCATFHSKLPKSRRAGGSCRFLYQKSVKSSMIVFWRVALIRPSYLLPTPFSESSLVTSTVWAEWRRTTSLEGRWFEYHLHHDCSGFHQVHCVHHIHQWWCFPGSTLFSYSHSLDDDASVFVDTFWQRFCHSCQHMSLKSKTETNSKKNLVSLRLTNSISFKKQNVFKLHLRLLWILMIYEMMPNRLSSLSICKSLCEMILYWISRVEVTCNEWNNRWIIIHFIILWK